MSAARGESESRRTGGMMSSREVQSEEPVGFTASLSLSSLLASLDHSNMTEARSSKLARQRSCSSDTSFHTTRLRTSTGQLIVVANRLPVTITADSSAEGGYRFSVSSGGLASALSGCKKSMDFTVRRRSLPLAVPAVFPTDSIPMTSFDFLFFFASFRARSLTKQWIGWPGMMTPSHVGRRVSQLRHGPL